MLITVDPVVVLIILAAILLPGSVYYLRVVLEERKKDLRNGMSREAAGEKHNVSVRLCALIAALSLSILAGCGTTLLLAS